MSHRHIQPNSCKRFGLTLVELLVSLGIIVLLIALLLPAIQRVRATLDAMVCASRLRQMGLAAHHHETDHGRLPPGYLGPAMENQEDYPLPAHYQRGQWIGHLPLLLPYLEQGLVIRDMNYDMNPDHVAPFPWFFKTTANDLNDSLYQIAQTRLKLFVCPSVSSYDPEKGMPFPPGGGTLLGVHTFNSILLGPFSTSWQDNYGNSSSFYPLGRTHYVGVAGCGTGSHPAYNLFAGIFTNRSKVSLAQITANDGTSNTLLYGEACGSQYQGSRFETIDLSWMGVSALGTYGGLHHPRTGQVIHFSGYHPGGVQFCFADGSVRSVRRGTTTDRDTPDWYVLQELAGWREGGRSNKSTLID